MTDSPPSTTAARSDDRSLRLLVYGAVVAVAVLGRLPALGAWWTLDDWGLLARAVGWESGHADLPARWFSQHLWWRLTWPLCGTDADAHAVLRLILHGLSSLLVVRIGERAGLGTGGRLVAGLLFAATPLAFTPLYWAAGVQELLAVTCALAAVERWLAPGSRSAFAAGALAVVSILAKEPGLGLPALLALLSLGGARRSRDMGAGVWTMLVFLVLVAICEGWLVSRHFATSAGQSYETGGPDAMLVNLMAFGWWLLTPGPVFASRFGWHMSAAGGGLFLLWALWAAWSWRRGDRLPTVTLVGALLALGPALPLLRQIRPYLALLPAAAFYLALGRLVPRRWTPRPVAVAVLAVLAAVWAFGGMRARLAGRNEMGFPADPLVRATSLSWQATELVRGLRWPAGTGERRLLLLQVPVAPDAADAARLRGEGFVAETELYRTLGGHRGPRFAVDDSVAVSWVNALYGASAEAMVITEYGEGFRVWGPLSNALLYAALTDVALGDFERARRHLTRAGETANERIAFVWDAGQMIVPLQMVLERKEEFVDWTVGLLGEGYSTAQVGGLQDVFFNLLAAATGRDVDELTAGSQLVEDPAAGN